jgi:hypothetical protein
MVPTGHGARPFRACRATWRKALLRSSNGIGNEKRPWLRESISSDSGCDADFPLPILPERSITGDQCTSCRPTGRRMGKQLLSIAGYATGWIVSG